MISLFRKIISFFSLFIAFIIVSACSGEKGHEQEKQKEVIKAETFVVKTEEVEDIYEISGTVISRNPTKIVSKIMGTVTEVKVEEGQRVSKGTLLITIDSPELKAALERAYSGVSEAEKAVSVAKVNARHVENTFSRYEKLYHEKAISKQEFEDIEVKKNIALDEVKRAEAVLAQAKSERDRAEAAYSYTKVIAPISGIVTEKPATLGLNVMPGTPLLTIETDTDLRLEVNADEKVLPKIGKGMKVPVYFDVLKMEIPSVIGEIVPSIDPVNRTFKLKLDLIKKRDVTLGMYGTVRLPLGKKNMIKIPASSVITRGQLSYVYVVNSQNTATLRLIRTGETKGDFVEVLSGLNGGEKVVKDALKAKDGAVISGE